MRRLLALILALALAPTASAAKVGPIFGLRAVGNPKLGYFVYPTDAGSTVHGAVAVTNTGDTSGTVKLYTADATTGATTGAVYLTDTAPAGVGTWISLERSGLTLKPGEQKQVKFTVHVPAGAKAGQYVGGIVAETIKEAQGPKSSRKTNVQIKVRNLSIVAVESDVPGPQVAKFTIGKVTAGGAQGRQQVFVHVSNDGNVLRKPKGSVTITSTSGAPIQKLPFRMDSFLPHTAVDYPVQLTKALAPGSYVASVELTYDGTGSSGPTTSSAAPQFTVSEENVGQVFKPSKPTQVGPGGVVAAKSSSNVWQWVAIGLGALLLAAGGYFFAVYRQRRPVTVSATPIPTPTPVSQPTGARCEGFHYWQVDWDAAEPGPDGRMTYPHRCRNCGTEVRAHDIGEASALAAEAEAEK